LDVARLVVAGFGLEQLLIVPAFVPPHKQAEEVTDSYHRYAMTVLATLDEPAISVSNLELVAPNRPYTFETIARLREYYGEEAGLFFVMGADSFQELATWRAPEKVLEGAAVIVVSRPGYEMAPGFLPEALAGRITDLRGERGRGLEEEATRGLIYLTDLLFDEVSSTEIRSRVASGQTIDGMVAPKVADYIRKYKLYAQGN